MSRPNFSFKINNDIISNNNSYQHITTYKNRLCVGQSSGQKMLKRSKHKNNLYGNTGGYGSYCNLDSFGDAISWGCGSGYSADIMGTPYVGSGQYVNCVSNVGLDTYYGCSCGNSS